jgi:hypothetical protein
MKRALATALSCLAIAAAGGIALATAASPAPRPDSARAGNAAAHQFSLLQEKLFSSLKSQNAISPERRLVSATYVCALQFGNRSWPVVNTIEQVPGAQVPRGYNQIVVLDGNLNVFKIIPYDTQYPMFCSGARLFVSGDLGIDNTAPYGNTLTFDANGNVDVTSTDANELPIEPTGQRSTYLLK